MNPSRFVFVLFLVIVLSSVPARAADAPSLDSAIVLFNAKRVPEAREQLLVVVASEPKNVSALWYLGRCELKMQHRAAAADTLARAVELSPKDHRILADYGNASLLRATELGVSFSAIGYARRGRDALERAVVLVPDNTGYREGLVQFYTRAPAIAGGSFERAYAHIAEIAKRDPARAAVIKANVLCSEKRYPEAFASCEEILRTETDNYLALYTLGRIASETGTGLARGDEALRRCLQLVPGVQEPDHAGARYRLGLIAEKDHRPADARREYEACLKLEPTYEKARDALAALPR